MLSSSVRHYPSQKERLDNPAEGSQMLQWQGQRVHMQMQDREDLPMKNRQDFGNTGDEGTATDAQKDFGGAHESGVSANGQPIRRRISRACDQCNQLRTKCDGKHPCTHCVDFGLTCEYARERKKRGKASRKDIAAQQAAAVAAPHSEESHPDSSNENDNTWDETKDETTPQSQRGVKRKRPSDGFQPTTLPLQKAGQESSTGHGTAFTGLEQANHVNSNPFGGANGDETHPRRNTLDSQNHSTTIDSRGIPIAMSDYSSIDDYHRSIVHPGTSVTGNNILHTGASSIGTPTLHGGMIPGYGENPYGVPSPNSHNGIAAYRLGESPLSAGFLGQSPVGASPGWFSLPSPSATLYPGLQNVAPIGSLRYPVLRPLLPYISAIIPIGLACDLLELYFSSTSSVFMQPQSPYILGFIFRKRSFLRQNNPRPCSPALLACMLWVGAQTCDSAFLTSPPSARGKICQKLLELTVGLLKPLIHAPADGMPTYTANTVTNGVALGGFGVALQSQAHEMSGGSPGASGALDDVATYIHLATVVSASEYKAASLRWWNAAWSLARELKLGREMPPNPEPDASHDVAVEQVDENGKLVGTAPSGGAHVSGTSTGVVSEEEREERRRIWWLLYIVDRHLALCYNRPLSLRDVECEGLLQPENDVVWQAGEFYPSETRTEANYYRPRGPSFQCTGHSIFGYFLPLMSILGEIVDVYHARNHPRFGLSNRHGSEWDNQAQGITQQLEAYGQSLRDFEAQNIGLPPVSEQTQPADYPAHADATQHEKRSPSNHSTGNQSSVPRMTESMLQTKIVVAYGTHLMHTLHILLNGKWDPISLLDDNDLWISSQSFVSATGHAVSAAEAINEILEHDPDISFMPFFFGIYLLQGSFLLLLIADKLQGEASPSVVRACETIVRAHEACVVTLNTEYQRNFRKAMRSALAQVRGRMFEDFDEVQKRRREVLALYRWTGDGTGLAL